MMLSKRVSELLASGAGYPLAKKYGAELRGAINLASNESPLRPSPKVVKAIKCEAARVGLYPDPSCRRLKLAIARYLGVGVGNVAVGNGSDELVDLVCKVFTDPGDRVLIPLPTFSIYELACRANGGVPSFLELKGFEWEPARLAEELRRCKLTFLGRPNNPTGNGISLAGLRSLLAEGKLVVVDEAYAEFAGYTVSREAARRDNLLVLRTFSKAFGLAGLRVGYAVGNPELISVLERVRAPFNVNSLAQAAAVAAVGDRRYLKKIVVLVRRGRALLQRELTALGARVLPSDANFLMVDVSTLGTGAQELCGFLARRGVMIRDLSNFRGAGPRWVRITVGTREQNERLIRLIKQFKGGAK